MTQRTNNFYELKCFQVLSVVCTVTFDESLTKPALFNSQSARLSCDIGQQQ